MVILFCQNDLVENLAAEDQDPPRPYVEITDGQARICNYPVRLSTGWNYRAWLKNHSLAYNHLNFYLIRARKAWRQRSCPPHGAAAEKVARNSPAGARDACPQHVDGQPVGCERRWRD